MYIYIYIYLILCKYIFIHEQLPGATDSPSQHLHGSRPGAGRLAALQGQAHAGMEMTSATGRDLGKPTF
jgi:hypothetical protein